MNPAVTRLDRACNVATTAEELARKFRSEIERNGITSIGIMVFSTDGAGTHLLHVEGDAIATMIRLMTNRTAP